jgi:olefin beta-lactone synthetase
LWNSSRTWMPSGTLHSPYGATEALPVSTISSDEISHARGKGACVGRPVREVTIKVIEPSESPIPEATAAAKIEGPAATLWHRMGDCGYVDAGGLLWFCGRRVERVETPDATMYTEPCEQVFRAHPGVTRCALIGLGVRGQQTPAIVVETSLRSDHELETLTSELRELARVSPETATITHFLFRSHFPVDVRHNAKIHRLELARWAASARTYTAPT